MAKKAKKARKGKKPNYSQGWETRRRNAAQTERLAWMNRGMDLANQGAMAAGLAPSTAPPTPQPESEFAIKAHALIVQGRKKDGARAVEGLLAQLALDHAFQGRKDAEGKLAEERKALFEAQNTNIIAGFIAEMETIERLNRGMPHTIITSGRTIARVVDALLKAGYNRNGFTVPDRRDEIMNRSHGSAG